MGANTAESAKPATSKHPPPRRALWRLLRLLHHTTPRPRTTANHTAMAATSGRERSNSKSSPLRKVLSLHQNPRKQQQHHHHHHHQEDEEAQLLHGTPPQRGEKDEPLTESCVWAYAVGHVLNDASAACWFSYLLVYLVRLGWWEGGWYYRVSGLCRILACVSSFSLSLSK